MKIENDYGIARFTCIILDEIPLVSPSPNETTKIKSYAVCIHPIPWNFPLLFPEQKPITLIDHFGPYIFSMDIPPVPGPNLDQHYPASASCQSMVTFGRKPSPLRISESWGPFSFWKWSIFVDKIVHVVKGTVYGSATSVIFAGNGDIYVCLTALPWSRWFTE